MLMPDHFSYIDAHIYKRVTHKYFLLDNQGGAILEWFLCRMASLKGPHT